MKSDKKWQWILGAVVGMVVIITVAFSTLSSTTNRTETSVQPKAQTEQPSSIINQPDAVQTPAESVNSIVQDGGFDQSEATNWVNFKLKVQQEDSGNFYASNRFNWSLYQEIKLEPSTWYSLNARLRKGMSNTPARICLQFKDSQGVGISEPFNYYHTFLNNEWEKVESVNFLTPVGTTAATLFLMSCDGATHDFDDISIVPTNMPIPSDAANNSQDQTSPELQQQEVNTTSEVTYTVIAGDTLSKIAFQFNISLEELTKANAITDASKIQPGQQLIIPTGSN